MTGLKAILAAMALAGNLPTSLGEAQRAEKLRSRASSTCCATEVSKQSIHSDANRLGLVIGNSSYPDADAPLTQSKDGFDIYLVQNATRDDMTRAIARLKTKVRPDSIVMVYFGGFGIQSGGQSYMIPVDAKILLHALFLQCGYE